MYKENICPECNTQNPPYANFCQNCGHQFPKIDLKSKDSPIEINSNILHNITLEAIEEELQILTNFAKDLISWINELDLQKIKKNDYDSYIENLKLILESKKRDLDNELQFFSSDVVDISIKVDFNKNPYELKVIASTTEEKLNQYIELFKKELERRNTAKTADAYVNLKP